MGKIHYLRRDENGGLHNEGFIQANGKELNMYYFSFPAISDWNDDGLLDIIISGNGPSKQQCNFPIYVNEGSKTEYKFGTPLVNIEEGGFGLPFMEPRVAPQIVDLDGDGKKDLVIGLNGGSFAGMDFYRNIGTKSNPVLDTPVAIFDTTGSGDWAPNAPGGKDQAECHPAFADWNGDGTLDILIGGESGWNNLHISYGIQSTSTSTSALLTTQNSFELRYSKKDVILKNNSNERFSYAIYSANGTLIVSSPSVDIGNSVVLNREFAQGVYVVSVTLQGAVNTKKFIVR